MRFHCVNTKANRRVGVREYRPGTSYDNHFHFAASSFPRLLSRKVHRQFALRHRGYRADVARLDRAPAKLRLADTQFDANFGADDSRSRGGSKSCGGGGSTTHCGGDCSSAEENEITMGRSVAVSSSMIPFHTDPPCAIELVNCSHAALVLGPPLPIWTSLHSQANCLVDVCYRTARPDGFYFRHFPTPPTLTRKLDGAASTSIKRSYCADVAWFDCAPPMRWLADTRLHAHLFI